MRGGQILPSREATLRCAGMFSAGMRGMDVSNPIPIAAVVRRLVDESEKRAGRLAALRESIAAGTYEVSAAVLAEAVVRSMQG
jgi:hypothetical protein